jgi:hypothetical protein
MAAGALWPGGLDLAAGRSPGFRQESAPDFEPVLTQPTMSYHFVGRFGPAAKKVGHSPMNLSGPVAIKNQPPSVAPAADESASLLDSPFRLFNANNRYMNRAVFVARVPDPTRMV